MSGRNRRAPRTLGGVVCATAAADEDGMKT